MEGVSGQFYDNKAKIEKPDDKYVSWECKESLGLLQKVLKPYIWRVEYKEQFSCSLNEKWNDEPRG